jgi:DNA-binding transcriptional ArsR family regulator
MKPDAADHPRQANGRSSFRSSTGTETDDRPAMVDRNTAKPDFWGRNSNVERFVRRYLHSETELRLICAIAEKPNKSFTFEELSALVSAPPPELSNAIITLEREGIAVTRRQGRSLAASLARNPVVRDMARRLSNLSRQDETRSALLNMVSE